MQIRGILWPTMGNPYISLESSRKDYFSFQCKLPYRQFYAMWHLRGAYVVWWHGGSSYSPPPDIATTTTHYCCINSQILYLNSHKSSFHSHVASSDVYLFNWHGLRQWLLVSISLKTCSGFQEHRPFLLKPLYKLYSQKLCLPLCLWYLN